MTTLRAGEPTVLRLEQWYALVNAMHGEDDGRWILLRHWNHNGDEDQRCIAISTRDASTLIIFLSWLVQILGDPHSLIPNARLNDLRRLAGLVKTHKETTSDRSTIYYLPTVMVEGGGPA